MMSQSAVRYNGRTTYIKDEELREFLKLLAFHREQALPDHANWIAVAIVGWMDDHEGLPPGLRDIELDEVLTGPDKVDAFTQYLDALLRLPVAEGPYDKARAALVVQRVLRELESNA